MITMQGFLLCAVLLITQDSDRMPTGFGASAAWLAGSSTGPVIAVGSPAYDSSRGAVWFISLVDGSVLRRIDGPSPGSEFGSALTVIDDQNDDGTQELIIAAPGHMGSGSVHVVSGQSGETLLTLSGDRRHDGFGHKLHTIQTSDGASHWLVGAPQSAGRGSCIPSSGRGYVRMYHGLEAQPVAEFFGTAIGEGFGYAIATNQPESLDEVVLAIGAPFSVEGETLGHGRVAIYFRSLAEKYHELRGATEGMEFGASVALQPSPGTGRQLVVVGSTAADANETGSGKIQLFALGDAEPRWTLKANERERGFGSVVHWWSSGRGGPDEVILAPAPLAQVFCLRRGESDAGIIHKVAVVSGSRVGGIAPAWSNCRHLLSNGLECGPIPFGAYLAGARGGYAENLSLILIASDDCFEGGEVWVYSIATSAILFRFHEWLVTNPQAGEK